MLQNWNYICLFIFFYNELNAACNRGTLKCSNPDSATSSKSLICDPLLNMVLDENRCIPQAIPNCLISLKPNECKVCKYGKFN